MSGTHARLSPSASKRWMTCPGSVKFIESLNVKSKGNKYTAEGTVAHTLHERGLLNGDAPENYLGETFTEDGFKIKVSQEMIEAVDASLDYISEIILNEEEEEGFETQVIVEEYVKLGKLGIPGLDGGTADCIILVWDRRGVKDKLIAVYVVDYKHGRGVKVYAEQNTQMMTYGTAVYLKYKKYITPETQFHLVVSQPRIHNIDKWSCSATYLKEWIHNELIPAAELTLEEDAPLVPSEDGCRFCDAKPNCPQLMKKTTELAQTEFENFMLPQVNVLTSDQKSTILKHRKLLEDFFKSVEKSVNKEMLQGSKEYNGHFKFVRKKTNRRLNALAFDEWSPIHDHLEEDEIYEKKYKTLTQLESTLKQKLGKKESDKIMGEITEKPEGEITIAPAADKRKAVAIKGLPEFEDLDEEDSDW
jgi:hypothetical protein